MAFWNRRKAEPEEPPKTIPETVCVEDIVAQRKANPPSRAFCIAALKGGCPWTDTPYYSSAGSTLSGEDDLHVYSSPEVARKLLPWFADEILTLNDAAELWAFLHNPRRTKDGRGTGLFMPPYGLSVDYDPEAAGYIRYGKVEIQRLGIAGFARGFNKSGELKEGHPERVWFPVCMVCGKPAPFQDGFHCISCDLTASVHTKCVPGRSAFGGSAFTIGGGGLRCPKCGATG